MPILKWITVPFLVLLVLNVPETGKATNTVSQTTRPATWAVAVERSGVPNLHRISERLYRGAQPTAEGMEELKKLGIKTIISLRAHHDDEDKVKGTGLVLIRIPMDTWHPTDEHVLLFLKAVEDPKNAPVFVHCQHGADRTGTMCAIYRIAVQGWTREEAIAEMTQGGFGFHKVWTNLIEFIQKIDIATIKKKISESKQN
jgi:protein tyrosine/serine phosphatase